jgi:hypothetical protein
VSAHHFAALKHVTMPQARKLVLLCLADDAGAQTGVAIPGLEEIMATACIGRSAALDAIATLVEDGYIVRLSSGSRGHRAEFLVRCPCPEHKGSGAADPNADKGSAKGPQRVRELPDPLKPSTSTTQSSSPADGFDAFWAAYPRKTGKDGARRAYAKAVKRADHDEIMAGLLRYAFPADVHYQPHPATWLNDGRWQDEQPTPPPTAQTQRRPTDNPWEIYSPTDEAYKREQWVMSHPNGQPYPGDPDTRVRDADGKLVWSDRP